MILCVNSQVILVQAGLIIAGLAVDLYYSVCNTGYITCMALLGLVASTTRPVRW